MTELKKVEKEDIEEKSRFVNFILHIELKCEKFVM